MASCSSRRQVVVKMTVGYYYRVNAETLLFNDGEDFAGITTGVDDQAVFPDFTI